LTTSNLDNNDGTVKIGNLLNRVQNFFEDSVRKGFSGSIRTEKKPAVEKSGSLEGTFVKGRRVVLSLDLKFSGKLKEGQAPPQILYHEDSVRKLV
jgi:hypothetical protein